MRPMRSAARASWSIERDAACGIRRSADRCQVFDQFAAVFEFGDCAAGVDQDHLELLVGLGIADQAGEGRDAGAGRET